MLIEHNDRTFTIEDRGNEKCTTDSMTYDGVNESGSLQWVRGKSETHYALASIKDDADFYVEIISDVPSVHATMDEAAWRELLDIIFEFDPGYEPGDQILINEDWSV